MIICTAASIVMCNDKYVRAMYLSDLDEWTLNEFDSNLFIALRERKAFP